ncbi:MAG TPA: hypothetical protein VJ603_01635 [Paucimonas sp.]|nr:hypothetical protein [Paucimonas sp.]HJW57035.1 hypothetical protein [Burkholderiaceae bacterium]
MNHSQMDAGIPVLTEVILPPAPIPAADAGPEQDTPAESPASKAGSDHEAMPDVDQIVLEKLHDLKQEISERVLQQILGRVDFALEQRVRDSLADVLQTAIEGLTKEIRQGLQQTMEEVIARAVSQELARLRAAQK